VKRRTVAPGISWRPAVVVVAPLGAGALAADDPVAVNQLTEQERKAGWRLLFDGKSFNGWHNFKRETARPCWQVKAGTLVCVDARNAGAIVTADSYD
jgi:hypothetical protein